jgi:hypothetical protein
MYPGDIAPSNTYGKIDSVPYLNIRRVSGLHAIALNKREAGI